LHAPSAWQSPPAPGHCRVAGRRSTRPPPRPPGPRRFRLRCPRFAPCTNPVQETLVNGYRLAGGLRRSARAGVADIVQAADLSFELAHHVGVVGEVLPGVLTPLAELLV